MAVETGHQVDGMLDMGSALERWLANGSEWFDALLPRLQAGALTEADIADVFQDIDAPTREAMLTSEGDKDRINVEKLAALLIHDKPFETLSINDLDFSREGQDGPVRGSVVLLGGGRDVVLTSTHGEPSLAYTCGGRDRVDGCARDDVLSGGGENDLIRGHNGNDYIEGGAGRDRLFGGNGDDFMLGDSGDGALFADGGKRDLIRGGRGHDWIEGNAGDDRLMGGSGRDTMTGGAGDDTMKGGSGADVFDYSDGAPAGHDVITDFKVGRDHIAIDDDLTYTIQEISIGAMIMVSDGSTICLEDVNGHVTDAIFI